MTESLSFKVGICSDHGGYELKEHLKKFLTSNNIEVIDFGAFSLNKDDDFPDFVIPLAEAISKNELSRGIAICGSGVGACIAANKVKKVRAALITEHFSAHQGVEDDGMMCLGGRITGIASAEEITLSFLKAIYKKEARFERRLQKIEAYEDYRKL